VERGKFRALVAIANLGGYVEKLTWEAPKLLYVGNVAEAIKGGGGKLSPAGGDPGEGRKQGPIG
jgi:hypothetical protein